MKQTLLILCLLCFFTRLHAQNVITVKGVVRDGTNQPIPGATIREKGGKNAAVSSGNGTYQIKVPGNASLEFRFIGSKTVEIKVNNRTNIDVRLIDDANNLNEVVVTGYGQETTRGGLTGSVSSISGTELAKTPVQNVAQALQGRIAGMQVTMGSGDPGAAPSIKIRGGTSITQSNDPLYVVDGVPQTDGLAFLDPMDIESIDVLKDASATAIYGARGANGVVLVTTKKLKSGKTTISYDGYVGARVTSRYLPVLNPLQYAQYTYENSARDAGRLTRFISTFGSYDSLQINYGNRPGINWQDEVLGKTVMNQYHKISINGGSDEIRYNLFYSKNNNDGLLLNSGANKDIAKLTVVNNIGKKAVVTGIVNYSNQAIYGTGGTQTGGNARLSFLQTLLQYRPVNSKRNDDFDLLDDVVDAFDNQGSPAFQSPLIALNSRKMQQSVKSLNASATVKYNLFKKLTYNGLLSYSSQTDKQKIFIDATNIQAIRAGGPNGSISDILTNRLSYNNVITYANTFAKDHKMDVSLGQEYIYNYLERFAASASGFPVVNNGFDDLGAGTIPGFPSSYAEDDKLLSFFARGNYGYKGRYLLSASLRRDGSSKFGSENVFGYFPSAAVAWRIIQEPFMHKIKMISDLKLRVSYGSSGNNRIANYAALSSFVTGNYALNNQIVSSVYQSYLANPFLKWETVVQRNIGLDLGFFRQRLTLTTDVYDNRSKDLLYNTRIPASSGFSTQLQNIGETSSKGVEFTLNSVNVKNDQFSWNTSLNIAFSRTKVIKLSNEENSLLVSSYNSAFNDYILQVGQPVGMMYGYISDGLYQVNDFNYNPATNAYSLKPGIVNNGNVVQPGFAKYKDLSGPQGTPDGLINDYDRTVIGNANPKFSGGVNNTFSYKGLDLSVFLDFTYGNDIYNANIQNNLAASGDYNSNLAFQANRWTNVNAAGQLVTSPVELEALNRGKNTIASITGTTAGRLTSYAIEDGSFLRINNISLGYTLPKKWLDKIKVKNARIYFTAYNLHVFTKYSGYDPEVSVINNPLTPGVDFSAYPRGKSYVAGLNLSL
ncbi:TonB-linked outer membrane protein, SusC/RagA family [Pedobacter steynii]|uniref:TonB-linked outer membrane protein, SusC/RagA family n=1 Tax=Pedobacter steynii TaxID=430522 RepID=A0A1G9JPH8_9SPHI|nr:TonB-dependent receptor [Pedobacter steynii]NQX38309.1 TonB-dependent receptor [Pedobacter steynii]SDL39115.1 TonB-linked outer membrane protein, SusC/RagA family [Pedobacter steynii]